MHINCGRFLAYISIGMSMLTGPAACTKYGRSPIPDAPIVGPSTQTRIKLERLLPPGRPVTVTVYGFPDLTGQHRTPTWFSSGDYSKAVTQGGGTILIDVLRSAGMGSWFNVVERAQIDDLLRERKLIEESYAGVTTIAKTENKSGHSKRRVMPPIKFADYLFAGGITGYDQRYVTGGLGATYLGIGPSVSYQKDVVNVTLRLIDVVTGKIVRSVNTSKTVYSIHLTTELRRYVTVSHLLEIGVGTSTSEPTLLAVREAIELAVYELLRECAHSPTWCIPTEKSPSQYRVPKQPRSRDTIPPPGKRN